MDNVRLESYFYTLSNEQIAKEPLKNKGSAKLLVYYKDTNAIEHHLFKDFFNLVAPEYALIINNTKVLKARFYTTKNNGSIRECLYHKHLDNEKFIFQARKKVRIKEQLWISQNMYILVTHVYENGLKEGVLFSHKQVLGKEEFLLFLHQQGTMPIPPYLKRRAQEQEELYYQNPFARHDGAIAAPTASLHFDSCDFEQLHSRYRIAYITLHVGAGTFSNVTCENITSHDMHEESYSIPHESVKIIQESKKLLPIGTTSMRAVEEYMRSKKRAGTTKLFLHPQNPPLCINSLLTNFHLPCSTLLMLVASIIGVEQMQKIYKEAIKEHYRFYSYGDAMLIL